MTTRRDFLSASLGAFALYALVGEAARARAGAPFDTAAWIRRHDAIAKALAAGELAPLAWQREVEALARGIDVAALAAHVAASEQRAVGNGMPSDPQKRLVWFRDASGARVNAHYGAALFRFGRDDVITPHGHRHMVSAHLVIEGRLRVRNYDRVGDEDGAMLLRPTRDAALGVGDVSTMSSARDNVHWFVPASGVATTFDVIVGDLTPGAPSYVIEAVDPLAAERRADGTLRAPIITFAAASVKYAAGD
ncbi:MAG TPA: hypothetical protein VFO79_14545 [Xanthomonadales bacterium]|nr:hypothetical protein [Xanthomonadales bacterium]